MEWSERFKNFLFALRVNMPERGPLPRDAMVPAYQNRAGARQPDIGPRQHCMQQTSKYDYYHVQIPAIGRPRSNLLRLSLSSLHSWSPCFSFLILLSWWRLDYSCFTLYWLSCITSFWSTLLPWSIVYFHPPHWTVCTGDVGVALSTKIQRTPLFCTCAVMIPLETQNVEKSHPAPSNLRNRRQI